MPLIDRLLVDIQSHSLWPPYDCMKMLWECSLDLACYFLLPDTDGRSSWRGLLVLSTGLIGWSAFVTCRRNMCNQVSDADGNKHHSHIVAQTSALQTPFCAADSKLLL